MNRRRSRLFAIVLAGLVGLAGCTASAPSVTAPVDAGAPLRPAPAAAPTPTATAPAPSSVVRVAYPYDPWTLSPWGTDDLAARDLAALWGLPLYRIDADGQLTEGLVRATSVEDGPEGLVVQLTLRPGRWSDGAPVVAEDVAATLRLHRTLSTTSASWGVLLAATATSDDTVELLLRAGTTRWPWLLAEVVSVVPARLATPEGLAAHDLVLPVVGGRYALTGREPGLRLTFRPHDGPLGPPANGGVDVLVVPSYETALGLLDRGEVDVVLGHLGLDAPARARSLADVRAAAPLGGTLVELWWDPDGPLGRDREARRVVADAVDLERFVAGLLRAEGATLDRLDLAAGPSLRTRGPAPLAGRSYTLAVPSGQEAVGFAARSLQRDVATAGGQVALAFVEPEEAARAVRGPHERPADGDARDGQLRVRRASPWQDVAGLVDELGGDTAARQLAAGWDASPRPDAALVAPLVPVDVPTPLFRIGVAHAWRGDVSGLTPSSWPGLALAGAADWTVAAS